MPGLCNHLCASQNPVNTFDLILTGSLCTDQSNLISKNQKQTRTSKPKTIQSKGNFVGKFLEIPEIIETTKK